MSFNEIRWHPLLGTWNIVASGRATRPWRDVKCPFCPGAPETGEGWDVISLDNRYPSLSTTPVISAAAPSFSETRPGYGRCKVVIETPDHEGDLDTISFKNLVKYVEILGRETEELARDPEIKYVAPFRNKGELIGVSIHHPHSQIYALPFIPLKIERELEFMTRYNREKGTCVICDIVKEEQGGGRVVYSNRDFILILPFYAQWPHECHIYPRRHFQLLSELTAMEKESLADILLITVAMYNSLFSFSLPYMMVIHQAPVKGQHPQYHLHIEFYTIHRYADKLKYAAGIEWGYWAFTYDELPENRVKELKQAARKAVERLGKQQYSPLGVFQP
ncbi:MAG: galactose-1-phosphate uridylyltransferase [Nitrososphaerota archaeon]|nr:galactose-1-phosphate uridylyltransferase [Candidatus Calditenuaceae archaeon]MDW8073156.1 galactose-1-phosphate uridylyltransferase [Nitrososphaerota archaeon]